MKYHLFAAILVGLLATASCGGVSGEDADDLIDAGDVDLDAAPLENDAAIEIAAAPADNDSLATPAEAHFLSPTGEREFAFSEEISAPVGDAGDFIEFEFPNNSNPSQVVRVTLDCTVTGQLDAVGSVTIFEDGVATNLRVDCNDGQQTLTVNNTKVQIAEVAFSSVTEPTHIDYTLEVVGFQ